YTFEHLISQHGGSRLGVLQRAETKTLTFVAQAHSLQQRGHLLDHLITGSLSGDLLTKSLANKVFLLNKLSLFRFFQLSLTESSELSTNELLVISLHARLIHPLIQISKITSHTNQFLWSCLFEARGLRKFASNLFSRCPRLLA